LLDWRSLTTTRPPPWWDRQDRKECRDRREALESRVQWASRGSKAQRGSKVAQALLG